MENALDKALANASLNAKMNGDTLHTENLDSIADPSFDGLPNLPDMRSSGEAHLAYNKDGIDYVVVPKPTEYDPRTVAFNSGYQPRMEEEYKRKQEVGLATRHEDVIQSIRASLLQLEHKIDHIVLSNKPAPINLHLDALADMITEMHSTIQNAKQSMPETPNHNHRSLHEWDDSTLLNELVERENDLMPFYFELLKRIPRELQQHVDESMKGKYQSLGVLSKLCAALSYVQQPQQQEYVINGNFNDTHPNAPNYAQTQQMSDIIQQLNQPSTEDIARASRNPDKYGSPTYPQSDSQSTILNEYRAVPKLPFVNGMVNPYPQG